MLSLVDFVKKHLPYVGLFATTLAYSQRALWLPLLMNKQVIQTKTLELLQGLQRTDGRVSVKKSLAMFAGSSIVLHTPLE
jgi:hypothetical protein